MWIGGSGRPACLAGHYTVYREEEGVVEHLKFLIRAHALERVVLIARQDCAFYSERLRIPQFGVEQQQRDHLSKVARRVRSMDRNLRVEACFAGAHDGTVRFERLEV